MGESRGRNRDYEKLDNASVRDGGGHQQQQQQQDDPKQERWSWSTFLSGCVIGFVTRGHVRTTQQRF